jgi:uncharacterized protein YoxC
MRGGAWKTNRTYVANWLNLNIKRLRIHAAMDQHRQPDETFQGDQELIEKMDEVMEQEQVRVPGITDLLQVASDTEAIMGRESTEEEKPQSDEKELEELMSDQHTPTLPSKEFRKPDKSSRKGKEPAKPVFEEGADDGSDNEHDYAESFASQRETAELREEVESITTKMAHLEDTIKGLLKEREALPGHLVTIREDINRQMTMMMDRLYSATESNLPQSSVQAAVTDIEAARDTAADRLNSAASYAQVPPKATSPLATRGAELKGKRRYKPIR